MDHDFKVFITFSGEHWADTQLPAAVIADLMDRSVNNNAARFPERDRGVFQRVAAGLLESSIGLHERSSIFAVLAVHRAPGIPM